MQTVIDIAREDLSWKNCEFIHKTKLKKILKAVLERFPCFKEVKVFELSILLTNDDRMHKLNYEFRGKEATTNVLSFPDKELNWKGLLEFKPDINYMYLGDIAFSFQTIKNEAVNQNKLFQNHFIHLFVHSILHLIGFDHENEEDANAMESLEVEILKNFSIFNIY